MIRISKLQATSPICLHPLPAASMHFAREILASERLGIEMVFYLTAL